MPQKLQTHLPGIAPSCFDGQSAPPRRQHQKGFALFAASPVDTIQTHGAGTTDREWRTRTPYTCFLAVSSSQCHVAGQVVMFQGLLWLYCYTRKSDAGVPICQSLPLLLWSSRCCQQRTFAKLLQLHLLPCLQTQL